MKDERRRTTRFSIAVEGKASRLASRRRHAWASVRSTDISAGGAYFLTALSARVGDRMQIVTGAALEFVGEVLRVERFVGSGFGVAVAFQPVTDDSHSSSWNFRTTDINRKAFQSYPRLHHVDRYVQQNHSESMPLAKAARIAAMEKTYFSAFFHQEVGVTFTEWLQYVRIARALRLISSRDYSITEVAVKVGFVSLRTFERTFKKWTSLTPQAFKKLMSPR